jgi:zinc transport system substrate-binding protein
VSDPGVSVPLAAVAALPAQDDLMRVDAVAESPRGANDRLLERGVRERLDLPAVATDDVVMVIAVRECRLVPRDPVADVDALDEAELQEEVENAVDGGDANRSSARVDSLVELLRARAAGLLSHRVQYGCAGTAGAEARAPEGGIGMRTPGRLRRHQKDDSDSHYRARVAGVKTRIVLSLIVLALSGCGGSAASQDRAVVAAFYPLAFASEVIGGEGVDVRNLTPPGVEPHDVELSGKDVSTIAAADTVFYLGEGFQPALEDAIDATSANAVDLLDSVDTRPSGDEEHGVDPHVWLDPVRYEAIATRIGAELDRQPAAVRFASRLRALDREYRRGLSNCARDEFVTSHAAFGYLANRYGLKQVAITGISPEAEPTPRDLEDVVRHVRAVGATTVFFETLVSPRLAETVAREVGATTAVLDPIEGLSTEEAAAGEDYFDVMRANLAALRKALACR